METTVYTCTEEACKRVPLTQGKDALLCPNGHSYPYATRNTVKVPVFAKELEYANEYAVDNAAEFHDNALRWVFNTFNESEDDLRSRLVSRLQLQPGDKVLITGAGAGNDLPYIVRELKGCGQIYAQDISEQMLLKGVERFSSLQAESGVSIHFSVSDATNLPFGDNFFDAAYHFGGINLFPSIKQGITEMGRVVKVGGAVVIGDEGVAPWLKNTELGKLLIKNNSLYEFEPPLSLLPDFAEKVNLSWELLNCFYVIDFVVSAASPKINMDVPHLGKRGGSLRTRYFGQIEGINPELRDKIYAEAEKRKVSRVEYLESILRDSLSVTKEYEN